jgi:D-alanyl-D-alanine carboxypeptidase
VLDAAYQQRWLHSLRPEDPSKPAGQKYGYGISELTWGPNAIYFHGGETPGFNSFIGYDPNNHVTLVVWTNLTLSPDGEPTANALMLRVLDTIYTVSPLAPAVGDPSQGTRLQALKAPPSGAASKGKLRWNFDPASA